MEPIEEKINGDFNVKKSKKKGLIVGGIISAIIIIAFVLIYFLVLTNPKFIFSKAIDKLFAVEIESYDSIKIATETKASIDLEDIIYQEELEDIEKITLKAGTQMDVSEKKQIVDLGLEYDKQEVADAKLYYNDGEMYAYLEGLFDKYIELEVDEESKKMLDETFEMIASEKDLKNTEKAIVIIKDELKSQIKENGKFESKKDKIDVGDDEVKVTKLTLTLNEKQLSKVLTNMLSNLAKNEEFIDCFEDEAIEDELKELAKLMKENKTEGKGNIKISLYTTGLLKNKLVAIDAQLYIPEEETTAVVSIVEEDENIYSYNVYGKIEGTKKDFINGKVEIEKDKDNKKEQSGKITIKLDITEVGSVKVEIAYSAEYNQGIDKIDTSNCINVNSLTDSDYQMILTKLMERPLIGDFIKNLVTTQNQNSIINGTEFEDDFITDPDTMNGSTNEITTIQNEVKDDKYSVKYSIPTGFEYDAEYSYDDMKFYDLENPDYSYISATVSTYWDVESKYIEDEIKWNYDYYLENADSYQNVKLSETKSIVVGDKTFKYVELNYDTSYDAKKQEVYVWYPLGEENLFIIELEAMDTTATEEIIKGFLNINVTQLN